MQRCVWSEAEDNYECKGVCVDSDLAVTFRDGEWVNGGMGEWVNEGMGE